MVDFSKFKVLEESQEEKQLHKEIETKKISEPKIENGLIKCPSIIKWMNIQEDFFGSSIREPIPNIIEKLITEMNNMKQNLVKIGNKYYYKKI